MKESSQQNISYRWVMLPGVWIYRWITLCILFLYCPVIWVNNCYRNKL